MNLIFSHQKEHFLHKYGMFLHKYGMFLHKCGMIAPFLFKMLNMMSLKDV